MRWTWTCARPVPERAWHDGGMSGPGRPPCGPGGAGAIRNTATGDASAGARPGPSSPLGDDPLAFRSEAALRAFGVYVRWYVRRDFHAVRLSRAGRPMTPPGRPVIVCANHPAWWDPLLFILLQLTLFGDRHGYGPMDAKALAKYRFFRRFGIFGLDLESRRGAETFLDVSARVLSDPAGMLWITAEGHFTDPRCRPVRLRPGIAHLARRIESAVILPLAVEYTFWGERRPELLVRFGPPIETGGGSIAAWVARLETALGRCMDALAEDSMARDGSRFETILRGRAGIGGVYDAWRRMRALARGERFDASHAGEEAGDLPPRSRADGVEAGSRRGDGGQGG
jgi:1-acyl-sn-glycerol-3-phosphate acyltransferase